jgi:hypothetical protein
MRKIMLDLAYWERKMDRPNEFDMAAINDAFKEHGTERRNMFDNEKLVLAEILLASCMRFNDDERGDLINRTVAKFDQFFAVEPMFYAHEGQIYRTWRYSYKDFVAAIPDVWAKKAISSIYTRLGVELDEEEINKVYNSDFLYSAFFELVADTLSARNYFTMDCGNDFRLFEQLSYFNMWHLFGKMGFEGLSPYEVFADIGVVTPPSSRWSIEVLSEEQMIRLNDIKSRTRGRDYPSALENTLLIDLAGV